MIGTDCLQPRLSAIPAYVPVTLDVAKGFKYGTDADFQRFGKELQNAVQCFDKMPLTLCHGKLIHTHRNIVCGLSWMCNYVTRNWVSAHGSEKTGIMGLPSRENKFNDIFSRLDTIHQRDGHGQTDGRTDGHRTRAKTALTHGVARLKIETCTG